MTEDERDFYEERAAIIEHCGGLPRPVAERIARERSWRPSRLFNAFLRSRGLRGPGQGEP